MLVFAPPVTNTNSPIYATRDSHYPVTNMAQRLFRYYGPRPAGVSVLKTGSTYTNVPSPTKEQIDAADIAYIGGHVYPIDSDEAEALVDAGYDVTEV